MKEYYQFDEKYQNIKGVLYARILSSKLLNSRPPWRSPEPARLPETFENIKSFRGALSSDLAG